MSLLARIGASLVMPLLVVACLLLAVWQSELAGKASTKAQHATARADALAERNAELVAGITATAARLDAIDERLGVLKQRTEQRITDVFWVLEKAKKDDKQTADWAGVRVPEPVVDGLCQQGFIDPAKRAGLCPGADAPVQ